MTDYDSIVQEIAAASEGVDWDVSILSNASALIWDNMTDLNWCGFYIMKNGVLKLGPFQGKAACTAIELGKGVCGTAAVRGQSVRVENVHLFDGHIACDSASNSEIVLPLKVNGTLYGVLDIDSEHLATFDETDKVWLEKIVKLFE